MLTYMQGCTKLCLGTFVIVLFLDRVVYPGTGHRAPVVRRELAVHLQRTMAHRSGTPVLQDEQYVYLQSDMMSCKFLSLTASSNPACMPQPAGVYTVGVVIVALVTVSTSA